MKTKILAAVLVFCMNLNGFAQNKKEDNNKPCTRAQLAQLIVDTLPWVKELPDVLQSNNFMLQVNVDSNHPNYEAIKLLYKKGIFVLFSESFMPNSQVTRFELAIVLNKVIDVFEKNLSVKFPVTKAYWVDSFKDVPQSHWAYDAIAYLSEREFLKGNTDGNFHGKQPATIKEVKLVLQRIKEKTEALLKEKELQNKSTLEPSTP